MSCVGGKHYPEKERLKKTVSSLMYEQAVMEINLISLSHNTAQGRFQARASFACDEFVQCLKLAHLMLTIQFDTYTNKRGCHLLF